MCLYVSYGLPSNEGGDGRDGTQGVAAAVVEVIKKVELFSNVDDIRCV